MNSVHSHLREAGGLPEKLNAPAPGDGSHKVGKCTKSSPGAL
ncbi:hypothetical protein [Aggregatilinea lenta]|nr:hypothetical protein [Aggregatilinea lenta]